MQKFFVECKPNSQPRTKSTTRGGRSAIYQPVTRKTVEGKRVPTDAAIMKRAVESVIRSQWKGTPIDGPVKLLITIWMPRVKATKANDVWHWKRPDWENIVKPIQDVLNGIAWHDDGQVCMASIVKMYVEPGMQTGLEISIGEVTL